MGICPGNCRNSGSCIPASSSAENAYLESIQQEARKLREWRPTCFSAAVLRITLPTRDDPPTFVLEGRLAGDWAKELIRVTRDLGPRTTSVFDLEEVFYVDPLGEETLLWLNRLGARFVTNTAYGKYLCQRLHLHRAPATKPVHKRRGGKAPPDTPVVPPK